MKPPRWIWGKPSKPMTSLAEFRLNEIAKAAGLYDLYVKVLESNWERKKQRRKRNRGGI